MDWIEALGDTLARDHGAVAVILYGSRARGAERPESDVDLLLLVPDDAPPAATRDARRVVSPDGVEVDVDACRSGARAASSRSAEFARARGIRGSVIRQRDALVLVARDEPEAALAPVGLGLLDALGAARHEVPPEVARPVERLAADDDEARRDLGR